MTPRVTPIYLTVLAVLGWQIIALPTTQLVAHVLAEFCDVTVEYLGCQQSTNRQCNKAGCEDEQCSCDMNSLGSAWVD